MIVNEIACRTILTPTGGFLAGFTHTINPYRGCAFGRSLCGLPDYAPEIARCRGERREWGAYLDVKVNAPEAYDKDHDRIRSRGSGPIRIYMSSVTDPWVPQERRYRVTRALLDRMAKRPPDQLVLQTHTPNPLWDIDRLLDLSARFPVTVQISVETDRETLGPPFPPHAYPVAERLAALKALRERGLDTVGVVAPLWPIEDLHGFARRLDEACSFVVVDHFLTGDGSRGGIRTRGRRVLGGQSFPDLLVEAGWAEWTELEALDRVVDSFRRILGPGRVGTSSTGFRHAAHRQLRGDSMRRGPEA